MAVRPGVSFATERWTSYAAEAEPLWREHYRELVALQPKSFPYGPDLRAYAGLDTAGVLHITTARKESRLVGYCVVVVRPHLHYSSALVGQEDSYFLTLGERRGMTFYRMLRYTLVALQRRGVKSVYFMTKVAGTDMSPVFERLGFVWTDKLFALSLEA